MRSRTVTRPGATKISSCGPGSTTRIALGAIRHAHAAIAHGRDDAMALTLGGFTIGMVEHDRAAAQEAFEAALALSPSSAFAYILGSVWSRLGRRRGARHRMGRASGCVSARSTRGAFAAWHAIFLGHFQRGRFEEATNATRKADPVQIPASASPTCSWRRRSESSGGSTRRRPPPRVVLALQPGFSISGHCVAVGAVPPLTAALTEALRSVGLPD